MWAKAVGPPDGAVPDAVQHILIVKWIARCDSWWLDETDCQVTDDASGLHKTSQWESEIQTASLSLWPYTLMTPYCPWFLKTEWRRREIVKAVRMFPVWLLKPDYWQNAVLSLWFIALCSSRLCPSICFIAIWKVWMFFHSFFYCKSYSNTRISVHKSNCLKANKLSPDSAPLMFKRILFNYCKNISLLFCQIKLHTVHSIFTKENWGNALFC